MELKPLAVETLRYRPFWSRIALCLAIAFVTLPPHLASAAIGDRIALDIASAEATFDKLYGQPVVTLTVTEASKRDLADFTTKNLGQRMALRIGGRVIATPVIREPILGGTAQIVRPGAMEDARLLAIHLKSGAKLEVEIIPQQTN